MKGGPSLELGEFGHGGAAPGLRKEDTTFGSGGAPLSLGFARHGAILLAVLRE